MKTYLIALSFFLVIFSSCQKIDEELPYNLYEEGTTINLVEVVNIDYTPPELYAFVTIKVDLSPLSDVQKERLTGLYFRHIRGQFERLDLDQTMFRFSPSSGDDCIRFGGVVKENGYLKETPPGREYCWDL